jgi:anti-anti-sigma factor
MARLMADDFSIVVRERTDGVEVTVTGELDVFTAASLKEALAAVSRGGGPVVAVQMAGVTFLDSTGLHALLDADRTLRAIGRRLSLVEPSPIVERLLELTGLRDHFADRFATAASADRATDDPPEQQLRDIMTELAGIVLTARSLRADLEQIIEFGCAVIPGCSAASLALLVDGRPTTVTVNDRIALELDFVQYDGTEGPCLAALDGKRIRVDVLEADERFPHFALGAADHRIHSVLSTPIVHDGEVVGTLNLYAHEPSAFDDTAEHIALVASGQAAQAIARSDVLTATRIRRDQLQAHYDEKAIVARAQGVLIATQRCSAEQAANLIRHAATATDEPLLTVAWRILETARRNAAQ